MSRAVALIGTGRLASALAPAMKAAGIRVVSVVARTEGSARRFRRRFPWLAGVTATAVRGKPDLFLLAVPDREIDRTASALAETIRRPGAVALHHAGGLGTEPLTPLASAGLATGVLHPLQVLGVAGSNLLQGSYSRIEGEPRARRVAESLAADLGMKVLKFRRRPDREARSAYHAGAALASNDLVALISLGVDLLTSSGIGRSQAVDALAALAEGAIRNLREGGVKGALTGPVARRDVATVAAHLDRLGRLSPEAREIHRLLSRRTLHLSGSATGSSDRPMKRILGRPGNR